MTVIQKLLEQNPWVRAEREMFGSPDSVEYKDLRSIDVAKTRIMY
jgi:hypothetical protein